MVTQTKGRANKVKGGNKRPNPDPYRIPVAPTPVLAEEGIDVMGMIGWICAVTLVALLLPLGAMLYLDILQAKHEVKSQMEKIEKLRREVERQQREKNANDTSQNQR